MAKTTVPTYLSAHQSIIDSGDATAITIDSSENISIGGQTNHDGAAVLIAHGDSGVTTYSDNADELVIENNGNAGISILTPNNATGSIIFGDSDDDDIGKIVYNHADNSLTLTATTTATSGNTTVGGTLGVTGAVTANAGVVVDNITIDGTEIDLSSGDLTVDVAGEIHLDADGGIVRIRDAGGDYGMFQISSSDFIVRSMVQDKDLLFKGNDGGSVITALTLDMSEAGAATFNSSVSAPSGFINGANGGIRIHTGGTKFFNITAANAARDNHMDIGASDARFKDLHIGGSIVNSGSITLDTAGRIDLSADDNGEIRLFDGSSMYGQFKDDSDRLTIQGLISDADMLFVINDGGSATTALKIDAADGGDALFYGDLQAPGIYVGSTNTSYDFYNNGTSYLNGAVTVDDALTVANAITVTNGNSTFTTASSWGAGLTIKQTNDDASPAYLSLHKDPASGHSTLADNDYIGFINMKAKDDAGNAHTYVELAGVATDVSSGAETSKFTINTWGAGTEYPTNLVATGGKVGIGTTSPGSYNSNTNNFVIRDSGSGGITISTGASNTGYVAFNDGEDTTIEGLIAYNQSNDVMSFRTAETDDRVVIDGSGNVGINHTTNTWGRLNVHENSATVASLVVSQGSGSGSALEINDGNTDAGGNLFEVKGNGQVGIGTTNAGYRLQVTDSTSSNNKTIASFTGEGVSDGTSAGGQYVAIVRGGAIGQSSGNVAGGLLLGISASPTGSNCGIRGTYEYTNGRDLQLFTSDDNTSAPTTKMVIKGDGKIGIGTTSPDGKLSVTSTAATNEDILYLKSGADNADEYLGIAWETAIGGNGPHGAIRVYNGPSANDSYMSLFTTTDGGTLTRGLTQDHLGNIGIGTTSPVNDLHLAGAADTAVYLKITNATTGNTAGDGSAIGIDADGDLIIHNAEAKDAKFYTSDTERMRITSDGHVGIGDTGATNYRLWVTGGVVPLMVKATSGNSSHEGIIINRSATDGVMIAFQQGGSEKGTISQSSNTTSYNTSSDYRLKENVDYTWDATTRIKQLKPARFNWVADDTNTLQDGFLAHEVSSIVPEAITGEKDGVYPEGHEKEGEVLPQGIDQSKLVPLMVKTIQELEARIKTLEDG